MVQSMKKKIERRDFLKSSTAFLAISAAPAILSFSKETITRGAGEVVLAQNLNAVTDADTIASDTVQDLVDNAVMAFSGIDNLGSAWKSIFPVLQKETMIGLKVNAVAGTRPKQLCTQKAVVQAIINGLKHMKVRGGTFSSNNIIVWDRWDEELEGAGFRLNETAPGPKIFGISKTMEDKEPKYGYDGNAVWNSLEDKAYFTKIISQICDYQINVPVLKNLGRGVTFAMKNHYGDFSSSYPFWGEIGTVFHQEFPQRICDLNAAALIKKRFILHLGDAILAKKSPGPVGPADFKYGGVLVSRDPLALDSVGVKIIREQGIELEYHDFMTLAEERGIGICNLDKIKIERI